MFKYMLKGWLNTKQNFLNAGPKKFAHGISFITKGIELLTGALQSIPQCIV